MPDGISGSAQKIDGAAVNLLAFIQQGAVRVDFTFGFLADMLRHIVHINDSGFVAQINRFRLKAAAAFFQPGLAARKNLVRAQLDVNDLHYGVFFFDHADVVKMERVVVEQLYLHQTHVRSALRDNLGQAGVEYACAAL